MPGAHPHEIEIGLDAALPSSGPGIRLDVHWRALGGADGKEAKTSATKVPRDNWGSHNRDHELSRWLRILEASAPSDRSMLKAFLGSARLKCNAELRSDRKGGRSRSFGVTVIGFGNDK